jgi:hypothetical protein
MTLPKIPSTRWRSGLRHCATSRKVAGSIPDGVIGNFHSFRPHYGPGIDSASNRNEYQEYFLGGKGGWCVGLTNLPPSCADCLEIWEPQPSGTLRACPDLYSDCFTFFAQNTKQYARWLQNFRESTLSPTSGQESKMRFIL